MPTPRMVQLAAIEVRFSAEDDWINILYRFAESLQPGGAAVVQILRHVLVRGLLQKIRQRFLKRLPQALQMSISGTGENNLKERFVKKIDTGKAVTKLQLAYKTLDTAILSGSTKRIEAAQRRLNQSKDELLEKIEGRQRASKRALERQQVRQAGMFLQSRGTIALGAVAGGIFRRTAMNVLAELTSATTVSRATVTTDGTTIGAGNIRVLDSPALETPSATQFLRNMRSRSTKRALWQQLEYGTGVESKREKQGKWLYGYQDGDTARGFYAYGTTPMNFLFPDNSVGGYYPEDRESAQAALNDIMMQLAPLPDNAYIF